jgi:exosome complex component RRP40
MTLGLGKISFRAQWPPSIHHMVKPAIASDLIVVLPGDNVTKHIDFPAKKEESSPKLGTGLRFDATTSQVYSTCSGRLERHRNKQVYFVEPNKIRRYRPALEDRVVGIVLGRAGPDGVGGDLYRLEIGAAHTALLSNMQFEGASKRNKPAFSPGQVIYARVAALHDQLLDPTLSCINGPHDTGVPRKDWMTNEGCYGELRGGTCCTISTNLARELLHPANIVLNELAASKLAFEVAIGVNGYLWIHSSVPEHTILIQNAIQNSDVLTAEQVRAMVKSLVYMVEKKLQQKRDAAS